MKKRKSPCVDICQFIGPSGWCIGCGRTRSESARWKKMKPYEANKIEKELKQRMTKMKKKHHLRCFKERNLFCPLRG